MTKMRSDCSTLRHSERSETIFQVRSKLIKMRSADCQKCEVIVQLVRHYERSETTFQV